MKFGERLRQIFRRASPPASVKELALTPDIRQSLLNQVSPNAMTSNRAAFGNAWDLMKPFWKSKERGKSSVLASGVVGFGALNVGLAALNVMWWAGFIDAAMAKNSAQISTYLGLYAALALGEAKSHGWYFGCRQKLKMEWRRHMQAQWTEKWLGDDHKAYYHMLSDDNAIDNPDHRLTEDIKWWVDDTVELASGAMNQSMQLGAFVGMLWGLSGTWSFNLNNQIYDIQGGLVWASLLVAGLGAWYVHKKGNPLTQLYNIERDFEGAQRTQLVRAKQNAESIALMGGEKVERAVVNKAIGNISDTWHKIVNRQVGLMNFTVAHERVSKLVPYIALGGYFAGDISWGKVVQAAYAGEKVQSAFSWPLAAYPQFFRWKTYTHRLTEMGAAIDAVKQHDLSAREFFVVTRDEGGKTVRLSNVTVNRPKGEGTLLDSVSMDLNPGDRLVMTGASGSGKTTFLRVVLGLYRSGHGEITLPKNTLFIPQKPYLPDVPLRDILTYPKPYDASAHSDEDMVNALVTAGLSRLAPYLQRDDLKGDYYFRTLSGGEQQRLRLAAILMRQPSLLILDEGTSSLDEDSSKYFYGTLVDLLKEKLPDTIMWSVVHQKNLIPFHTLHAHLQEKTVKLSPVAPG